MRRSGLICLLLAALPTSILSATSGWVAEPAVQRRLAAGEVVVQAGGAVDPAAPHGRARGAISVHATAAEIWSVMTDCSEARWFVPGLKHCRRIDAALDGSWEDIEQEVRYSRLLPAVRYGR